MVARWRPSIAPWVEDFVRQLAGFPNATHDDDVDACTQALNKLAWSANAHLYSCSALLVTILVLI